MKLESDVGRTKDYSWIHHTHDKMNINSHTGFHGQWPSRPIPFEPYCSVQDIVYQPITIDRAEGPKAQFFPLNGYEP